MDLITLSKSKSKNLQTYTMERSTE